MKFIVKVDIILEEKMKKNIVAIVLLLVFLVGCGKGSNNASEDTFVATYPADFISVAPLADESANTKMVLRNMHEGIYKYNTDGFLDLGIAENIDITKEDEYIVFNIKLKDGVKFHNGKEVTSEDVKYSYERLAGLVDGITPDMVAGSGYFKQLLNGEEEGFKKGKIEIIDDNTLKVYMDGSMGTLTTMYTIADGLIVPSDYSEDEQAEHPIGVGPYEFVEYMEGDHISMKAFEDYYGEVPDVKEVEFRKYADSSTMPIAFENKEIDLLTVNNENYERIKEEGYEISESLSNDVRVLYMNERAGKLFENKDLRYAINYAIDKEKMLNAISNGRGAVLYSHFTPVLGEYYNDNLKDVFSYNPEKAKEYLSKAGYENGLSVSIKTIAENEIEQDLVALIIEDLEKIGINAKNDPIPWNTYYEEVYKGFNFDMAILNVVGYPDPSRVLSRYESKSGKNMTGFNDQNYDRIIDEARQSVEQDSISKEKYKELQRIITEDGLGVFTIDPGVATAISKDYTGYKDYPFAFVDISLVERK